MADYSHKVESYSDAQLAEAIKRGICDYICMGSWKFALLEEAAERLSGEAARRASEASDPVNA